MLNLQNANASKSRVISWCFPQNIPPHTTNDRNRDEEDGAEDEVTVADRKYFRECGFLGGHLVRPCPNGGHDEELESGGWISLLKSSRVHKSHS